MTTPNQRRAYARIARVNGALPLNEDYNGWKNRETWNVALWLGNDEGLYNHAKEFATQGYRALAADLIEMGNTKTKDGVAWDDPAIDTESLDDMLADDF